MKKITIFIIIALLIFTVLIFGCVSKAPPQSGSTPTGEVPELTAEDLNIEQPADEDTSIDELSEV